MNSIPEQMEYRPGLAGGPKGSFGPVFAVMSVIAVLAVAACVVGRLCGRRLSKTNSAAAKQALDFWADSSDTEKGYEPKPPPPPMKPVGSARASIHDVDDGFEIKFASPKPAEKRESRGSFPLRPQNSVPPRPGQQPQHNVLRQGVPRHYANFSCPQNAAKTAENKPWHSVPGKQMYNHN